MCKAIRLNISFLRNGRTEVGGSAGGGGGEEENVPPPLRQICLTVCWFGAFISDDIFFFACQRVLPRSEYVFGDDLFFGGGGGGCLSARFCWKRGHI